MAKEVAKKGIRVNVVEPGFIDTEFLEQAHKTTAVERIPLKRLGHPNDIAEAVYFLASNNYITGQVLSVDGGLGINM